MGTDNRRGLSIGSVPTQFKLGNRAACAENLTPYVNKRKLKNLMRGVHTQRLQREGIDVETSEDKKVIRHRIKVRVAAEAREIQDIARSHAVTAMEELAKMTTDPRTNGAVRVAAIQAIFDRAYGKPNQTNTNLNVDANGKPTDVTQGELVQRIAETLRRVEAITGGAAQTSEGEGKPADVRISDRNPNGSSFH